MPSPVGHTIINLSLYIFIASSKFFFRSWKYLSFCLLLGLTSDIDFIFIILGLSIDFHRTMTNSLLFAVTAAVLFSLFFIKKKKCSLEKWIYFSADFSLSAFIP